MFSSEESRAERDEAARAPVREAGGGESEGFEEAERQLIENASHGDQHAAHRILGDAPDAVEDDRAAEGGEPDTASADERDG